METLYYSDPQVNFAFSQKTWQTSNGHKLQHMHALTKPKKNMMTHMPSLLPYEYSMAPRDLDLFGP